MIENRKYIRLKAPIGLVYRTLRKNKKGKETLTLVINISGGGLSFIPKEDVRQGDLLSLRIHIPHSKEPIEAIGEIAWFFVSNISSSNEKNKVVREAGLRFRELSPKNLNQILEYVHTIGIG
ncbi:MAG: PilZ domain-containing protein [Candidatus Omnitrophota bacterium]